MTRVWPLSMSSLARNQLPPSGAVALCIIAETAVVLSNDHVGMFKASRSSCHIDELHVVLG